MKKFLRSSLRKKSPSPDRKGSPDGRNLVYDVKEKELPKLHKAAWNGDTNKVKQLAKKGDLNLLDKDNRTPLHLACARGHTDVVQFLITGKAKLNICDNGQHSPLMKAVQGDHVHCVRILLEHNADPNLVDRDGMTALHIAEHTGSADSVSLLLDNGAMVNATNKDGRTPLHLSTFTASDDVVELLLLKDADVNATDKDQRTPLMYACESDQITIVKSLLESKADTEIKDSKGWTAADHAVMNAHHGCSHLINEHSAAHRARPASRQGGMFRAPGTPAAAVATNVDVNYGLGSPAADNEEDILSQEEESISKMSNSQPGGDSWGDTSEADDTTYGGQPANQIKVGVNLSKFVPGSDSESVKSVPGTKSRIPRAISKESITSIGSKKGTGIDVGTSKIPRLQTKNKNNASPSVTPRQDHVESPRHEQMESPRSDFAPTPRSNKSAADTEAESIVFDDGDDFLDLSESMNSDSPEKVSPYKPSTVSEPAQDVGSKGKPLVNGNIDMAEEKSKNAVLAEELGLDEVDEIDFDDEDDSQIGVIPMMDLDEPKTPKSLYPIATTTNNSGQGITGMSASSPKSANPKDDDEEDEDWDTDTDLLPSQTGSRKDGGSALSTPRAYPYASSLSSTPRAEPLAKSSPKAIPLNKLSTKSTGAKLLRSEDVVDFSDDDTEETESEWEKERKAEKERKELEKQMKEEEEKEKQRMLQWEKEEQEKKDKEQREMKEALEQEEREKNERRRQRLEEERKQREEDLRKRQEEERKREDERLREEERAKQEEERRRDEEKRRDEERRRANFKRLEEERRLREEEDRIRMAEEERRSAERRRKMDDERQEAEKRRQEEQKKQEEKWKENQRKLEEEKRKLEEDMLEQERKRELERKRIAEQFHKSYDDKINDFDDSASDSWSNQPSPIPFRPASGLSNRSISPRHPYTPGSANPSWKQVLTEEADGLSFSDTDTEGDGMHSYISSTPLPKSVTSPPPPPSSGNNDPNAVIQMQETLRDHKRQIDKERSARITIETRIRKLEMEKQDLQRKIDKLSQSKTTLEQEKMELETNMRNINYKLTEETEKAKSAESLLAKTKEQLDRKEQQYIQELEARQKVELSTRTLQMELREALTTIKQLEEDKSEARKELAHERSARNVQEQLNLDHSKVQDALQQAEIFSRLESADESRKFALDQSDRLKAELYGLKMELERVRMRYKDDQGMLAVENEELNNRIEELKSDIRLNEEALAHATMTYNAHLGAAKNENSLLASNLDKEKSSNEKLQTEVQSLNNRLTAANVELDKTQQAKSEIERTTQREKDDMHRTIERLEMELHHLRDSVQSKAQNLGSVESRVKSLEHELHLNSLQLTERTGQLSSAQRELEQRRSMLDSVQNELMKEKEERVKISAKYEAITDRLSSTQTEMSQLKYENNDVQGKLDNLMSSMKFDEGKSEAAYVEKNKNLADMVEKLNSDLSRAEEKHDKQEQHISQLQQELADVIKKLSTAEARLESSEKECAQLIRDKEVHANIHDKLIGSESEKMGLQHQVADLQSKIDIAEKKLQETSLELLDAKARLEQAKDMEDNLHQVEIEKTKVASSLEHEAKRVEMLEKELEDSQKVRSSLEALVANLKSANIHMEDRLSEETAARSLYAREAEDHKALWDSEVKSRSKLGLRIAQLERSRTEVSEQVTEEKRKTRKVAELKRQADARAESEVMRNQHLQKEINMLKAALKSAKKKLKELESPDSLIKTLRFDYDQERKTFGDTLNGLRRQNEDLARQLQVENDMRSSLETSNRQLQQELAAAKVIKKEKEKLEKTCKKMQDQLDKIKTNLGTGFVEKSEMDRFKQDVETKARKEINYKLEEVNAYLEEQAQARDRLDSIRNNNEAQMKNDYERQINDFRAEVARMKAGHQEGLVQKETAEAEALRYKELYENELKMRQKLSEQLEKSNDKLSDAKAQLSLEKQRNRHRIENGLDLGNSYISPGPAVTDPMTQKVRNELDKSIARHLGSIDLTPSIDMRENTPNNWSSTPGPNASPLDKSNSQYMSILKKNYFV